MNVVVIDEFPKFLASVPSDTVNATQITNTFNVTQPIVIHSKLIRVTSYFHVKKPYMEEYEDQDTLKIEFMSEAPLWDLSSPGLSRHVYRTLNYKG